MGIIREYVGVIRKYITYIYIYKGIMRDFVVYRDYKGILYIYIYIYIGIMGAYLIYIYICTYI